MSESQARDARRTALKEWLKRGYVHACGAALVGGQPHKDYVIQLGMTEQRIFFGYDVIDNAHFAAGAEVARRQAELCAGKWIFRRTTSWRPVALSPRRTSRSWCVPMPVIGGNAGAALGTCDLRGRPSPAGDRSRSSKELGLKSHVLLPGFRQYDELPAYYGLAGAFVHASTTEQWGLVVNEAMASGLPVLVSNRCGWRWTSWRMDRTGSNLIPPTNRHWLRVSRKSRPTMIAEDPWGKRAVSESATGDRSALQAVYWKQRNAPLSVARRRHAGPTVCFCIFSHKGTSDASRGGNRQPVAARAACSAASDVCLRRYRS